VGKRVDCKFVIGKKDVTIESPCLSPVETLWNIYGLGPIKNYNNSQ
jgi:hypothetical protein